MKDRYIVADININVDINCKIDINTSDAFKYYYMVLLKSEDIPMGTPAPKFNLKGIDGEYHSLDSFKDKAAIVIIFMCVHCPYVQEIEHQLIELQEDYEDMDIQLIGINPNDAERYPEDSFEGMQERADDMEYNFLYLRDETQSVAREYDAVCTPDIYVFDNNHELYYHGRIEEVSDALEAILDGATHYQPQQIPSQGCSIKWTD